MKPIERLVMHAGKVSGMSLEEVNAMLVESALDPVKDANWRFISRYVPLTTREPAALASLSFGSARKPPRGKNPQQPKAARASRPAQEQPKAEPQQAKAPRLRLIQGGRA